MVDSTPPHFSADIQSRAQDALAAHLTHSTVDTETHRRYHDRLSGELEYIRTTGLAPDISAMTALVDRARKLGIVVGPGRRSAPSSLVLYLLGVTQIDPLAHGLIVERWFSDPAIDTDRDTVEAAGITVLTILGMKELASIADIDAPDDDTTTLNYIANGVTDDIFRLSSAGMKRLSRYAQPRNQEHLTALVAAYRPPFMNDGTTDELSRRMRSYTNTDRDADAFQSTPGFPEDNLTDLPSVTDVLAETFGLLLFQEQFIEIVRRITGWSDLVSELYRRRAQGKSRDQDLQDELVDAALVQAALSKEQEAHLRELIVRSSHTVLKSHAVAYTRIGWQMAYRHAHQMDVRRPHLTEQVLRGERVVDPDHPSHREEGI